jgi:hypothetical protein
MQEHFHFTTDRANQPKAAKEAVRRAPSRFLDARSKKSANPPIGRMETVAGLSELDFRKIINHPPFKLFFPNTV